MRSRRQRKELEHDSSGSWCRRSWCCRRRRSLPYQLGETEECTPHLAENFDVEACPRSIISIPLSRIFLQERSHPTKTFPLFHIHLSGNSHVQPYVPRLLSGLAVAGRRVLYAPRDHSPKPQDTTAEVGDVIAFSRSGTHNVFIHPSGDCTETGAIQVGSTVATPPEPRTPSPRRILEKWSLPATLPPTAKTPP